MTTQGSIRQSHQRAFPVQPNPAGELPSSHQIIASGCIGGRKYDICRVRVVVTRLSPACRVRLFPLQHPRMYRSSTPRNTAISQCPIPTCLFHCSASVGCLFANTVKLMATPAPRAVSPVASLSPSIITRPATPAPPVLPPSFCEADPTLHCRLLQYINNTVGLAPADRLVLGGVFQNLPVLDLPATSELLNRVQLLAATNLKLLANLFTAGLLGRQPDSLHAVAHRDDRGIQRVLAAPAPRRPKTHRASVSSGNTTHARTDTVHLIPFSIATRSA